MKTKLQHTEREAFTLEDVRDFVDEADRTDFDRGCVVKAVVTFGGKIKSLSVEAE